MCEKSVFKKIIDFEEAKQLIEQIRQDRGCPSGYKDLDRLSGGLVKDGVTLIAARPAMGKTSLVLNIVNRLSQQNDGTILVLSARTPPEEFAMRLFSLGAGLAPERFFDKVLPQATVVTKFSDYYAAKQSRIKFERLTSLTLENIRDCCYAIPDLRLVVVDPAEEIYTPIDFSAESIIWNPPKESPAAIFRWLQELAHDLNVPVLCTTHLPRNLERRKNKRPKLEDLKKTGIPTDLVDQIIFLYRDRYYNPEGKEGAEWIVAKSPRRITGTVRLDCDYTTRRFTEIKKYG